MDEVPLLQVVPIVRALADHDVDYVMIGALAAALQGSPLRTNDADICPSREPANLERLAAALVDLDAKVYSTATPEGIRWARDAVALSHAEIWNLISPYGRLDISYRPSGTEGYEDLVKRSVLLDVEGVPARVASLHDVIRSKEAAGRQKDREQLPTLRKLLERLTEPNG